MGEYKKLGITVRTYYEISDAYIYGGIGSTGYSMLETEGNGEMLHNDFDEYIRKQKKALADLLNVPEECIQVITQEEYEEKTEEDQESGRG